MALGSSGRRIVVEFIGDASSLKSNAREGEAALQGFSGKAQAAGRIAGKALAGGLLLAGAAAVSATKAAAEDEAAQAQLAQQLKQAANATDAQIASTEDWISKTSLATGVADDELRPAMAQLATATGDVGEAQDLLSLAMDISAGSGKSLAVVTKGLATAQVKGATGLSKFGIETKDAAGHTLSLADATQALADKYDGAAAKAADTAAGKTKIMQVQFGELQEQIGANLLPVMTKLASVGLQVVNWISKNTTTVGIFVAALGGLLTLVWAVGVATKVGAAAQAIWSAATAVAGAVSTAMNSTFVLRLQLLALDAAAWLKSTAALVANKVATAAAMVASIAMSAATKAMAAAQWLLNVAMEANPIGLVVIAVAALVAGLILAYKHSETFRNIVNAAFGAVAHAAGAAVDFIRDHWRLILAILTGPVGIAVGLITKHWDDIKLGAQILIGWVKENWPKVKEFIVTPFTDAKQHIGEVWGDIKSGFGAVRDKLRDDADAIKSHVVDAFNALLAPIQNLIDKVQWLWDKISALAGKISSLPSLPHIRGLAKGGVVTKPTVALIGEAGPEAVVPLGMVGSLSRTAGAPATGGTTVQVIVQSLDPRTAGKAVIDALRQAERELGRPLLVSAP